jgi:RNA polymerase sigma-70 factor, ECF subfamily
MGYMERSTPFGAIASAAGPATGEQELALGADMREYVLSARAAWPNFAVSEREFAGYVAARSPDAVLPPLAHAADLLLACACARAVTSAIAAFQREYGPVMDRVLLHRRAAAPLADDVRQIVHQRLLMGDATKGSPAKIGDYRGTGPLRSWVASATAKTLLTLLRTSNRRRELADDSERAALGVQLDPELEYLKQHYKSEVEEAIVYALERLGDRERTLLRLYLGERSSIDVLGALYGVNRATAARWISAARRSLMSGARERLQARLRLSESECDSLVALVNSRLHVSIVRRLSEA